METIDQIIKSIETHTSMENKLGCSNLSIGRGRVTSDPKSIWIVNGSNTSNWRYKYDINGTVIGTTTTEPNITYNGDGHVISKNMYCAGFFLGKKTGKQEFLLEETKNGSNKTTVRKCCITIENASTYVNRNRSIEELILALSTDDKTYSFASLEEAKQKIREQLHEIEKSEQELKKLEEQKRLQQLEYEEEQKKIKNQEEQKLSELEFKRREEAHLEEIRKQQEMIDNNKKELVATLDELSKKVEKYQNAAFFIRRQVALKETPNLSTEQYNIKFSHIYDGIPVIINGGPGTGKTTTLIQRLKFLIDPEGINDHLLNNNLKKIPIDKMDIVMKDGGDWIYFSPTELLRQYLRDDMNYEGLRDTNNRTVVWSEHLQKILRDKYQLVGGDKARFDFKKKEHQGVNLIKSNQMDAIGSFVKYYINSQKQRLITVGNIECSRFTWYKRGQIITRICGEAVKVEDFAGLCRLLFKLEAAVHEIIPDVPSVKEIRDTYKQNLDNLSLDLQSKLKLNTELYEKLLSLVSSWQKPALTDDSDIDTDMDSEEDILEEIVFNPEQKIQSQLRSLLRNLSISLYDNSLKLVGRDLAMYTLIKDTINMDALLSLGNYTFFMKKFDSVIGNYESFLFNSISKLYKGFRKDVLKAKNPNWNLSLLERIINEQNNRPLHPQEQSLLLGFINKISYSVYKINSTKFMEMKHKFSLAYKELCKPVIGVDEATDYSQLDYFAISSLCHYSISSVTLCGDHMQCMNDNGITNWNDLQSKLIFPKLDVMSLNISYRQGPELMKLANSLYEKAMRVPSPYICALNGLENTPRPLWFESNDEVEKAEWIADRVLEIKDNYNCVPSIAVFVSDEESGKKLKMLLDDIERLSDAGIDVVYSAGDSLASNDKLRIFPISMVKGMEFEAVFFHNIDNLGKNNIVERYIYVGLSRATFYLGVTSDKLKEEGLIEIKKQFVKNGKWNSLIDEPDNKSEFYQTNVSRSEQIQQRQVIGESTNIETGNDSSAQNVIWHNKSAKGLNDTTKETLKLLKEGYNVSEVAELRELKEGTIYFHIATLVEHGILNIEDYIDLETINSVVKAYNSFDNPNFTLTELRNATGNEDMSFEVIKVVLADIRRKKL